MTPHPVTMHPTSLVLHVDRFDRSAMRYASRSRKSRTVNLEAEILTLGALWDFLQTVNLEMTRCSCSQHPQFYYIDFLL